MNYNIIDIRTYSIRTNIHLAGWKIVVHMVNLLVMVDISIYHVEICTVLINLLYTVVV